MTTAGSESASEAVRREGTVSGTCLVMFARDIGFQVDLAEAERRLSATSRHRVVRLRRPSPAWFDYDPPPLRLQIDAEPVEVAGCRTAAAIEGLLYDFGAVLVTYRIPLDGPLDELVALSRGLYDNRPLLDHAAGVVERLVELIREAVTKPSASDLVEDYAVFVLEHWGEASPAEYVARHEAVLARILQSEQIELSPGEIASSLSGRMAYSTNDLAIVDWNAAVLLDRAAADVVAVLQHANVELLELRLLDRQLDRLLDRSQELFARQKGLALWPLDHGGRDLREFAELQTDSALLFEGVNNAIKLLGDQYLARLYRLAASKLNLPEWDASVLRKLATADSVYQKVTDANATSRLELLEIVIIVLIAISILLPFVGLGY